MNNVLDEYKFPIDLKSMSIKQLEFLCAQIRSFLIEAVSKTGGHLASNLGVVELTVALHRVFNMPKDKIVFDVGHQSYVHKILTGRAELFDTLRQEGGLSGFPKTEESEYDSFNTGHSSTSVSAALGLARARDLKGENHKVIALLGDGALTGGLAYEAISDAGNAKNDLIVILNDNEMSVSKNVGGISEYLSKIRTRQSYFKIKSATAAALDKSAFGRALTSVLRKFKNGIKQMLMQQNIFEDLGFTYLGPVDGHDIYKVSEMLERAKNTSGPVIVHVCTKKGHGYMPAETKPQAFHGISRFDAASGNLLKKKLTADYSAIFGRHLVRIARENEKVVAISPAMTLGSGLKSFARNFPKRLFDVGICESHAVTSAAGLAISGFVPAVCIYSSFLQRAYDQIIHDVALQNLHVVFCIDRAGVVGDDGETHQGIFDIAFMNQIPNMAILAPACFYDLECMLKYAFCVHQGPIALRYPRGNEQYTGPRYEFQFGKSNIVKRGNDVTIISVGNLLKAAVNSAERLEKEGISAEVINLGTVKPLDAKTIIESVTKTGAVLTLEDGIVYGGVGEAIGALLEKNGINAITEYRGYDNFVKQAKVSSIHKKYGLDDEGIYNWATSAIKKKRG
ncbi:MAG: 1-deoxy-D-xylulose-5-phosphate synthase [Ruminococcaceae bacterium]|nr:1-deoxy-D-xylulose-5-phosphate synthase [Oscillospiraceae bacterium]